MKIWSGIAMVLAMWCAGAVAHADDTPEGAKMALVINQVDYQTLTPLPDTDTEAAEMTKALTQVGFDVTSVRDATLDGSGGHPNMRQVIKDFRRKLAGSPGAIGFIYYTGHGMADPTDDKGDNYLLSIDADIKIAADLPSSGIKLGDLMDGMSNTNATAVIIVVDACRNTPSLGKGASKGLVAVAADPNTLIAYSTDLGDIAGVGVYAPVLAAELVKPGMTVTQVFDAVQVQVANETGRKQRPWSNNRIYDTLCLAGCNITVNNIPAPVDADWQREQAVWTSAKECVDYSSYITQYPKGAFVSQAQGRLASAPCKGDTGNSTPVQVAMQMPPASLPAAPAVASTVPVTAGSLKLAAKQPSPWYDDDSEMLVDSCDSDANADHDTDRVPGALAVLDRDVKPVKAIADCKRALGKYGDNRHLAYNLGRAYELNKDYGNARAVYQQAADAGNGAAMFGMGNLYFAGEGVNKDPAQAAAWFQKGAAAGNNESMLYLGILYDGGLGVPDDPAQARKWYKAAIAAGNVGAQTLLDMMAK